MSSSESELSDSDIEVIIVTNRGTLQTKVICF